jgi:hypothetical protein
VKTSAPIAPNTATPIPISVAPSVAPSVIAAATTIPAISPSPQLPRLHQRWQS